MAANSTEDRIRERAYALWESEGRPHGRDAEHWAQATREEGGSDADATKAKGRGRAKPARSDADAAPKRSPGRPRKVRADDDRDTAPAKAKSGRKPRAAADTGSRDVPAKPAKEPAGKTAGRRASGAKSADKGGTGGSATAQGKDDAPARTPDDNPGGDVTPIIPDESVSPT